MPDSGHDRLIQKGGGPGGLDIVVDTDALRAAAAALARVGADFAGRSGGFAARVHLQDHAFGSLPQAAAPYRDYLRTVAEARAALETIGTQIQQVSGDLHASADNYDGADTP
jgi:hypothetical protein